MLNPEDIVEEEVIVIGWSESFEAEIWAVHKHFSEPPDLGVDTERWHVITSYLLCRDFAASSLRWS
jgi:hypothetical protein